MTDSDSLTRPTSLDTALESGEVPTSAIPAQRAPERTAAARSVPRHADAPLDLTDRGVLIRSWMHTLHGQTLDPRPRTSGHLPSVRELLPTVLSWHVAYAVIALVGALVVQRSGSGSIVADELTAAGRPGLVVATLVLWWGGVAAASVLWAAAIASARSR